MKSNSTAFSRSISSTLIKPDPIRGLGSGFRIRRCFLRLLLTNRARCSRFQSWVVYTVPTEGQRKRFSTFTIQSRMSETGSTEHCDRVRVVPVFSVPCPRVCLANEIHMPRFWLVLEVCSYMLDFRRKDLCSMLQAVPSISQRESEKKENGLLQTTIL
jgi:hypothetical protein